MASTSTSVHRLAARSLHRTQWLSYRQQQVPLHARREYLPRSFATTTIRAAQKSPTSQDSPLERTDANKTSEEVASNHVSSSDIATAESSSDDGTRYFNDPFFKKLSYAEKAAYMRLSPKERLQHEEYHERLGQEFGPDSDAVRDVEALIEVEVDETKEELRGEKILDRPDRPPKLAEDFATMNEPDLNIAPDEEFQDDDISSTAHGELDQHREMREYMRLASWEMPMLAKLSTRFERPDRKVQPLRWRYTTYLGTLHPAANKVVLEFSPNMLGLTAAHTAKLIKLAGPRYHPHDNEVRMSCESFPSQAQNKRYLGDTLAKLIEEAKNDSDTMEDLPFDFRHARERKKLSFPKEWRVTRGRKGELERTRGERAKLDTEKVEGPVDGMKAIEEARYKAVNDVTAQAALAAQAAAPARGKFR